MDIIRTIAAGFLFLIRKISKKSRRTCALVMTGAVVIAAVAFTFHGLHAGGKNNVYASVSDDKDHLTIRMSQRKNSCTVWTQLFQAY